MFSLSVGYAKQFSRLFVIFTITTTYTMTTVTQKLRIMESLDALDQTQSEKVLAYIRSMLNASHNEDHYKRFKREAMKEIRKALKTDRSLKLQA